MAQKLNFSKHQSIKEYCFADDEDAIIRIDLRDTNLLARMDEGRKKIKEFAKELENIDNDSDDTIVTKIMELDKKVKDTIDYIFNSNVSEVAFGVTSSISIIDGEPRFVTLMNALMPEVEKEISLEQQEADKTIESFVAQAKNFK